MAGTSGDLTATGSVTLTKPSTDTMVTLGISGTYGTVTFVVEGSTDGTNYFALAASAFADGSLATGTISPSDNTEVAWRVPCEGLTRVRARATAVGSGTVSFRLDSAAFVGPSYITTNTTSSAAASTTNITSTSATAFTVGPSGATNPMIQVDAATGSAATGIKITGAAAGSGIAVAVISSGTNENMTVDAKGSGTVTFNSTATGAITAKRATRVDVASTTALTVGPVGTTDPMLTVDTNTGSAVTGIKITGAAAASGVAVVVTSSGTNENATIDAKGSGTLTFNSTATGNIVMKRSLDISTKDIVTDGTTGTIIGTATTQKLGFYNLAPVVQPAASTNSATGTTGGSTGVSIDTTFTGGSGSTSYTVGGCILRLKQLGLLAT